jgi:hypothetical protein
VELIHLAQNRDKCQVFCEHDSEYYGDIYEGETVEHLRNYEFLKKDSAPYS